MYRTPDDLLDFFKGKRTLILGFGREGRSSYQLLRRLLPDGVLGIADARELPPPDDRVTMHSGASYLDAMKDYDVVLKSPGIPFLDVDIPPHCTVTCQTNLFLKYSDSTVIGVTGTKGKTTTSTLIARMLESAALNVRLTGNIGVPVFDSLYTSENAVTVMELSCHQLEFMTGSPHIAVLTNIYPEHLDHYRDGFAGYLHAKLNITRFQQANDFFIFNPRSKAADYIDPAALSAKVIEADTDRHEPFLDELCRQNPHLRGEHNRQNVYVAAAAVRRLGVPDEAIARAVQAFAGIPNRMELVCSSGGVDYYNDSIATIPYSVLMGVDSLGAVGSLIVGGMDRGLDYTEFADELSRRPIKNIICLPDTGHKIAALLAERPCRAHVLSVADMREAVEAAVRLTPSGTACVLSPAAASYNVYRDFEEKGAHYKKLLKDVLDRKSDN